MCDFLDVCYYPSYRGTDISETICVDILSIASKTLLTHKTFRSTIWYQLSFNDLFL